MNKDSSARKTPSPRGLLITTGEDTWKTEQSTAARTITVEASLSQIDTVRLKEIQELAEEGWLGKIGGLYIQFLATLGEQKVHQAYKVQRDLIHTQLESQLDGAHLRSVATLAVVFAAERVLRKFIELHFPELFDLYKQKADAGCKAMIGTTSDEVSENAELSPLNKLIEAINSAIHTELAKVVSLKSSENETLPPGPALFEKPIAFIDREHLYIGAGTTYEWYAGLCRQRGVELSFGWDAVLREARSSYGSVLKQRGHKGNVRLLDLPRSLLNENVEVESGDFSRDFGQNP